MPTNNFDDTFEEESVFEENSEVDENLGEVDRRFDLAYCYRVLLKQSLFENANSATLTVEKEVRAFIRNRLEVLMGVSSEDQSSSGFTFEESIALKALAQKMLDNSTVLNTKSHKKSKFAADLRTNGAKMHMAEPKPKKHKTDSFQQENKSSKTNKKIKLSPESEISNTGMGPVEENCMPTPEGALASDGKHYYEGQIIEENGQKFKIKIQEVEGHKYVLRQNVTAQVIPSNRVPMPNSYQMEQISRQQALDSLQNLDPLASVAVQQFTETK